MSTRPRIDPVTPLAGFTLLALVAIPADLPAQGAAAETGQRASRGHDAPLYRDVGEERLPTGELEGLSMDAAIADLDGDDDPDVVIANEHRPNLLLLNDGAGSFELAGDRLPRVGRDSEDVAIADYDGDGDLDVVVVSEDDRVNELYLNRGDATFEDGGDRIPVTGTTNAVVARDLTGDGAPDLILGNNGQNVFLENDGSGRFTDETSDRLPADEDRSFDGDLIDVDRDGDLDVVTSNSTVDLSAGRIDSAPWRVYLNDGSGRFRLATGEVFPPGVTGVGFDVEAADYDGDGLVDLYLASRGTADRLLAGVAR